MTLGTHGHAWGGSREVKSKPRLEKSKVHGLTVLVTRSPKHEKAHFYLTGFT